MRMYKKVILYFCISFLYFGCKTRGFTDECKYPVGTLLFSKIDFEFGEMYTGTERIDSFRVYNPMHQNIRLKFADMLPYVNIVRELRDTVNYTGVEFEIAAKESELFYLKLSVADSFPVGSIKEPIHVDINGNVFVQPLGVFATVVENPENLLRQNGKGYPVLTIVRDTFLFDSVTDGREWRVSVPIKNTGEQPLLIRRIETDCDCVVSEMEGKMILPGEEKVLKVTFDTMGRTGMQYRVIRLYTNAPRSPLKKVILRGYIS